MTAAEHVFSQSEKFIHTLFGDHRGVMFVWTLDRTLPKGSRHAQSDDAFFYPDEASQAVQHIAQSDILGKDVYLAPQLFKTKEGRRRKENVALCPVAWADLDTAPPDQVSPAPSLVTETSPGRYHGYWRLERACEPSEAEEISRRIAHAHRDIGCDPSGWDLTQLLRVPGTHNHKYPESPEVTVASFDPAPVALSAFKALPEPPARVETPLTAPDATEPPLRLSGSDLALWQGAHSDDRSKWAMIMIGVLKANGLSDAMIEAAMVDHPIYQAKASDTWRGDRGLIVKDIRRVLAYIRDHPLPRFVDSIDVALESAESATEGATTSTDTTAYPIWSLGDMASHQDEMPEPLIDGFVWPGRVHWIYSSPGAGKTMLALALGMHIAMGAKFCGRDAKQGGVLLIEEDSPFSVMGEYVQTLASIYGVDLATLPFWVNSTQGLRLTTPEACDKVLEAVRACPVRPSMMVFDTAESLVPSDRFSSAELECFKGLLQKLTAIGIAVFVLDHTRKEPPQQKGDDAPAKTNYMDLLYGSRAKSSSSDVMIYISGNIASGIRLHFEKFRGAVPPMIDMEFDTEMGFTARERIQNMQQTPSQKKLLAWWNANNPVKWRTREEIIEEAGISEGTSRNLLSSMVTGRWLESRGSTRDRQWRVNQNLEIARG